MESLKPNIACYEDSNALHEDVLSVPVTQTKCQHALFPLGMEKMGKTKFCVVHCGIAVRKVTDIQGLAF